jgi:phospholipase/carboxylesterase
MVPLVPETIPQLKATPVLVSAGNHDPIVPSENVRELVALLRRAGADVTVCFENAGHDLTDMTSRPRDAGSRRKPDEPHP